MPITPDSKDLDIVQDKCIEIFDASSSANVGEICAELMSIEGMPMHNPVHHYLLPAAMLTAANINSSSPREKLISDLAKARERCKDIPGGICGFNGCCGAGVSAGTFASVWLNASPLSKSAWSIANRITAEALMAVASVEGPRCCKRVCFLSLKASVPLIKELLDVDLGSPDFVCSFSHISRECKKELCPFYPIK